MVYGSASEEKAEICTTDWMESFTGRHVSLPQPGPDQIDITDIAHALALLCRFNGHCLRFYSVAEHSLHVSEWLRREGHSLRLQLLGLLHDASEAYIGDITTPVKRVIPAAGVLDHDISATVWASLQISSPLGDECRVLKQADVIALMTEAGELMPSGGREWACSACPDMQMVISCWEPDEAERRFLAGYSHLMGEGAAE